jgi:DNA-binding protein HU-beta
MGTVHKEALIKAVAEKTGGTVAATRATVEAFIDLTRDRAEAGDTVRLMGFGSFSVKARPARMGRNPATGAAMEIPETRRLTFKASKAN